MVGVDAIAEAAGTNKMTLYRHFASKDDLVGGVPALPPRARPRDLGRSFEARASGRSAGRNCAPGLARHAEHVVNRRRAAAATLANAADHRLCRCLPPRRSSPRPQAVGRMPKRRPIRSRRPIAELRTVPEAQASVSERMDFIGALLGVRYRANTLIGGPQRPEQIVVRDDAFDCVTFCEVVLAAAIARNMAEFETSLRRIRYDHGNVQWDQRNHYFAEWSKRNIENNICRPVPIEPNTVIEKTVNGQRPQGKRQVSILAIPKAALLEHAKLLAPGDIIGFTSRRPNLDYFHTGLVTFSKTEVLMLRNAAQSRGHVIDEKMASLATVNTVKYVSLLRATETETAKAARKAP